MKVQFTYDNYIWFEMLWELINQLLFGGAENFSKHSF